MNYRGQNYLGQSKIKLILNDELTKGINKTPFISLGIYYALRLPASMQFFDWHPCQATILFFYSQKK
jgi:hypothetical protein